jgi:serine/threonine protein kinase
MPGLRGLELNAPRGVPAASFHPGCHMSPLDLTPDTLDDFFRTGVAPAARQQRQLTHWLEREGRPGESLLDALTRAELLIPAARRIVGVCRIGSLALPPRGQLFSPAGLAWVNEVAPEPADDPSDTPTHIFETVPGVRLAGETSASLSGETSANGAILTVGCFRLHEVIGRGDSGAVYAAESVFGGGRVALKLLPTEGARANAAAERFFNGAAVAQHLNLTGCLPVQAAAREFGFAYVVSPLVLGSVRARHETAPLAAAEATSVCAQAARSLAEVHAAGFAHGNVKVGNLLLDSSRVLLADFALPDEALVPRSSQTPQLQRADVSALVGVYAGLLGDKSGVPAVCRDVARREFATAATFADALDVAAASMSARPTAHNDSIFAPTEVFDDKPTPRIGERLGKCLLAAKIGEGATGVVFRATHQTLGIDVAVKVLSSVTQSQDELAGQFSAEARMLARLNHPNIVRIWDFETAADAPPFLVLEFVDGQNLDELIQTRGSLPADQAVPLFTQVVAGLAAAHRQAGLIHRDIKPGNILLGLNGEVKVADLGLASILETEKELTSRVAGTVAYMPPEQANGVIGLDLRSDIYALGATMYHALTGGLPFTGRSRAEVMFKHASVAPVPPDQREPSVPPGLSAVVVKMLAKKPEDRYQTYDELLAALAACDAPAAPKPTSGATAKGSLLRRLFSR